MNILAIECPECRNNTWFVSHEGGEDIKIRCTSCHTSFTAKVSLEYLFKMDVSEKQIIK